MYSVLWSEHTNKELIKIGSNSQCSWRCGAGEGDTSPSRTLRDTWVPLVNVRLESSRKTKVLFIILSEYIQVSLLSLASSFMRSNKKFQQLLLNLIKWNLQQWISFVNLEILIVVTFTTKTWNGRVCGGWIFFYMAYLLQVIKDSILYSWK